MWEVIRGSLLSTHKRMYSWRNKKQQFSFGVCHAKTCHGAYADSEGPDQFVHPLSLIRTFTIHSYRINGSCRKFPIRLYIWVGCSGILLFVFTLEDTVTHVAAHLKTAPFL